MSQGQKQAGDINSRVRLPIMMQGYGQQPPGPLRYEHMYCQCGCGAPVDSVGAMHAAQRHPHPVVQYSGAGMVPHQIYPSPYHAHQQHEMAQAQQQYQSQLAAAAAMPPYAGYGRTGPKVESYGTPELSYRSPMDLSRAYIVPAVPATGHYPPHGAHIPFYSQHPGYSSFEGETSEHTAAAARASAPPEAQPPPNQSNPSARKNESILSSLLAARSEQSSSASASASADEAPPSKGQGAAASPTLTPDNKKISSKSTSGHGSATGRSKPLSRTTSVVSSVSTGSSGHRHPPSSPSHSGQTASAHVDRGTRISAENPGTQAPIHLANMQGYQTPVHGMAGFAGMAPPTPGVVIAAGASPPAIASSAHPPEAIHPMHYAAGGTPAAPPLMSFASADAMEEHMRQQEKKLQKRAANRKSAQLSRKRKKALIEELKYENQDLQRHEDILEVIPDPVFAFDARDGKVWFASNSASAQFGLPVDELLSGSFFDLMTADCSKRLRTLIDGAAKDIPETDSVLLYERMTVRFNKRKAAILLGELSGRLSRQGDVINAVCSVRPLSMATDDNVGKGYFGDASTSELAGDTAGDQGSSGDDTGSGGAGAASGSIEGSSGGTTGSTSMADDGSSSVPSLSSLEVKQGTRRGTSSSGSVGGSFGGGSGSGGEGGATNSDCDSPSSGGNEGDVEVHTDSDGGTNERGAGRLRGGTARAKSYPATSPSDSIFEQKVQADEGGGGGPENRINDPGAKERQCGKRRHRNQDARSPRQMKYGDSASVESQPAAKQQRDRDRVEGETVEGSEERARAGGKSKRPNERYRDNPPPEKHERREQQSLAQKVAEVDSMPTNDKNEEQNSRSGGGKRAKGGMHTKDHAP